MEGSVLILSGKTFRMRVTLVQLNALDSVPVQSARHDPSHFLQAGTEPFFGAGTSSEPQIIKQGCVKHHYTSSER